MVYGFITNIESALNVDIDFSLNSASSKKLYLNTAFCKEYTYNEDGKNNFSVGKTYRTRLQGIEKVKLPHPSKKHHRLVVDAMTEFRNEVYRCGCFVDYKIVGIDVYGRVIANLYNPVSGRCLNDIFLQKKYRSVFRPYKTNNIAK